MSSLRYFLSAFACLLSLAQLNASSIRDPRKEALIELTIPPLMNFQILSEKQFSSDLSDKIVSDALLLNLSANAPWSIALTPRNIPENSTLQVKTNESDDWITLSENVNTALIAKRSRVQAHTYPIDILYKGDPVTPRKAIELVITNALQAGDTYQNEMLEITEKTKMPKEAP